MADPLERHGSASSPGSAPKQTYATQHTLSCTHCRQRKIKCDKVHPCGPCQRSSRDCVFPERVRHPKKKQSTSKTGNDELMGRLERMEQLIEKMKGEGKDIHGNSTAKSQSSRSPSMPQITREISEGSRSQDGGSEVVEEGSSRYIGSAFFRSLTNEVEGLKQTMDEVSDDEYMPDLGLTPSDTQSSHMSMLFGSSPLPSAELRLLHPSPSNMSTLCDLYIKNCDPMFKVLHTPSLRNLVAHATSNVQNIPSGNYVEALLFALYYAAITSLTQEECLQWFQDGRDRLLARYRTGTETSLANADMMNTKEMGTLQALLIFLSSARTNDDSQFVWTMASVAVRLAHSLGLHRENPKANFSIFQTEMRRRVWWQVVHLDMRCCDDRGSDPLVLDNSFNTRRPLNIHDSDMDPESMQPLLERREFTQMTKTHVSNVFWDTAQRVGFMVPVKGGEENIPSAISVDEKSYRVDQLEQRLEREILVYCDTANPLAWATSVVIRLVMARHRLSIYHPPMHDDRSPSHRFVSRETVLETAVQVLEYCNLLDNEPTVAKWKWYFRTHVQWHALAATLAELCVQDRGSLVDRAWTIVDTVFDEWAARIADSKNGMLWRPIKKLMSKAQAKRNEAMAQMSATVSPQQRPLPQFETYNPLQDPSFANIPYHPDSVLGLAQKYNLHEGLPSDILSSLNVSDPEGTINWAEWDDFMQDFELTDPAAAELKALEEDPSFRGTWW